jgi:hypothetical protein
MSVQSGTRMPNGTRKVNGEEPRSVYEWVADTARENPVLVVGGAAVVGALVVMAVSSRSAPETRVRAVERRIRRDLAAAEKALRRVDTSGFTSSLADIPSAVAARIGSLDTAQFEALKDRASQLAGQIAARASEVMRSRY